MRVRIRTAVVVLVWAVLLGTVLILVALEWRGAPLPAPRPPESCSAPDPAGGDGCLTPTARRLFDRTVAQFGAPGPGAPIRSATCWGDRAANPASDHGSGRACDFFPTRPATFAEGAERDAGWAVANWLRDNAADLDVRYVIWQGRIWVRGGTDDGGWGRPYDGGGVYDPADATGGHHDHVHVSVGP
jgi:hypothetical protein